MDDARTALRLRDAVLALLASGIAFLLPTLATGLDSTTTLAGAVLAVALAALLSGAHGSAGLGARAFSSGVVARRPAPLVLTTRATDPTHHPLRPRAPGAR